MFFSTLTALALLGHGTYGHMMLAKPVPFGQQTLDNSPLKDAKPGTELSDYPCKQRAGVYEMPSGGFNKAKVGEPQELSFLGSAVHGGGTCQISISLDQEPTSTSVFKVIKVFEGGCPMGNLSFTYPSSTPNGKLTLAWTWMNKVGNRETYMNCAPIDVTGGSDDKSAFEKLPNQYLVNLPSSECSSVEGTDLEIPFPGEFVEKAPGVSLAKATGPGCAALAAAQTQGVAVSPDTSASVPAYSASETATTAESSSQPSSTSSAPSSSSASTSSPPYSTTTSSMVTSIRPDTTTSASFPTMTVSGDAGIYGPAGTASSAVPTGSGTASGESCATNGALICSGTSQFGLCNNGKVIFQKVAPGTQCHEGQILRRRYFGRAN